MVRAGILTYADGANGHPLHRAGERSDGHQIPGVHPVLKLDKNAGDNILHQRLRTKGDRQPQGTGTRQQRGDIHADFRQYNHDGDGADDHRQRVAAQGQQRAGAGARQRPAVDIRHQTVFDKACQQRPADGGEEQDQRDTNKNINGLFPRAVMQPVPEIKQPPRVQQQHNCHADRQNTRHLQGYGHPAIHPLLQFRVVTLNLRRQGDRFRQPAGKQARDKGRNADNRQAFERRPHHKFQAIARIEQGEETEHNKIGAGQPVPHQRKGANKEAEKGEGAIGQVQQAVGDRFFIVEDEVQRPDGNAQHDQHVRQRPELHVNLVGNNRHGNQQAITDQPAQHAEPHRPVFGALIRNGEGAKVRHAWAEDQPQEGFKELNQGKRIEEQSLLKRDGFVSGIKAVSQQLTDKQRQGQQQ